MGACGAGCASLVLGFLCSCLSPLVTHISRFGLALFVVLDLDYLMSRNGYYILLLFLVCSIVTVSSPLGILICYCPYLSYSGLDEPVQSPIIFILLHAAAFSCPLYFLTPRSAHHFLLCLCYYCCPNITHIVQHSNVSSSFQRPVSS